MSGVFVPTCEHIARRVAEAPECALPTEAQPEHPIRFLASGARLQGFSVLDDAERRLAIISAARELAWGRVASA